MYWGYIRSRAKFNVPPGALRAHENNPRNVGFPALSAEKRDKDEAPGDRYLASLSFFLANERT